MEPAAPDNSFAVALRAAIDRAGLSNRETAKRAKIDESHLYKLLAGEPSHPQPRTVQRLANALTAPELLRFTQRPTREERLDVMEQRLDRLEDLIRDLFRRVLGESPGDPA